MLLLSDSDLLIFIIVTGKYSSVENETDTESSISVHRSHTTQSLDAATITWWNIKIKEDPR